MDGHSYNWASVGYSNAYPNLSYNNHQSVSILSEFIPNMCAKIFGVYLLLDFSLTVKAATLIFISGCGLAISSAKEGKSGFIYNLVKS